MCIIPKSNANPISGITSFNGSITAFNGTKFPKQLPKKIPHITADTPHNANNFIKFPSPLAYFFFFIMNKHPSANNNPYPASLNISPKNII